MSEVRVARRMGRAVGRPAAAQSHQRNCAEVSLRPSLYFLCLVTGAMTLDLKLTDTFIE